MGSTPADVNRLTYIHTRKLIAIPPERACPVSLRMNSAPKPRTAPGAAYPAAAIRRVATCNAALRFEDSENMMADRNAIAAPNAPRRNVERMSGPRSAALALFSSANQISLKTGAAKQTNRMLEQRADAPNPSIGESFIRACDCHLELVC